MKNYDRNIYQYQPAMMTQFPPMYPPGWVPEEQKMHLNEPIQTNQHFADQNINSGGVGNVPKGLAIELMDIIVRGNLEEIEGFLGNYKVTIGQYNIDVKKVISGEFNHTCLFYAALIKDNDAYIILKQ